jgi:preprotein translocase subunit YajC
MTDAFNLLPLLLGQPQTSGAAESGGGGGQLITMLVTFGLIIVVFYFLVIRPQNRKQKAAKKMLENIRRGDRVLTVGGLHGFVDSVKEDSVIIKVDENVKIKFSKSAVSQILERKEDSGDSKE